MAASVSAQRSAHKPSFASVAAMAPPTHPVSKSAKDVEKLRPAVPNMLPTQKSPVSMDAKANEHSQKMQALAASLQTTSLTSNEPGSDQGRQETEKSAPLSVDEKSQVSSSTKATSQDSTSIISTATHHMDEKESLRPDDSASVKAGEEDESHSGPASGAPSSRVGSEAGGKFAFRDQFNEISERIGPNSRAALAARHVNPTIAEEAAKALPGAPLVIDAIISGTSAQNKAPVVTGVLAFKQTAPDEKLIEALESPKDRLFLLQLEEQVIAFIRNQKETILDLPPCNSFCRLLAHRLGDYYNLSHIVDNAVAAVRFYKMPYSSLPPSLGTLYKPPMTMGPPPTSQPSMKIMRRAGHASDSHTPRSGNGTTASSIAPSKAGSDHDDSQIGTGVASPTESTMAKDKSLLTREEREAQYKEARDRIFKDFGAEADTPDAERSNETSTHVSRASSATGKKKPKKNKNHDDGFEARSQFNVIYPSNPYYGNAYNQAANPMAFTNTYLTPNFSQPVPDQTQYYNPYLPPQSMYQYQTPTQQMPMPSGTPQYPQAGASEGYMYPGQQVQTPQYMSSISSQNPMMMPSPTPSNSSMIHKGQLQRPPMPGHDQAWQQGSFTGSYPGPSTPQQVYPQPVPRSPSMNTPSVHYPYGQLPYPASPGGRPPHPLPGSYTRPNLNPQTQAFVPGTNMGIHSTQPTPYINRPVPFQGYGPQQVAPNGLMGNNIQYGHSQNTYQQPPLQPQMPQFGSMPPLPPSGNHMMPQMDTHATRKTSAHSNHSTHSQSPLQSSLSKWGTPANLPPKPPPPEVPHPSTNVIPQSFGGQAMPTFHNGTYSKPNGA